MVGGGHQRDRKEIYSPSSYQICNFPCHTSTLLHPSLVNTLQKKDEAVTLKEEVCSGQGTWRHSNRKWPRRSPDRTIWRSCFCLKTSGHFLPRTLPGNLDLTIPVWGCCGLTSLMMLFISFTLHLWGMCFGEKEILGVLKIFNSDFKELNFWLQRNELLSCNRQNLFLSC